MKQNKANKKQIQNYDETKCKNKAKEKKWSEKTKWSKANQIKQLQKKETKCKNKAKNK